MEEAPKLKHVTEISKAVLASKERSYSIKRETEIEYWTIIRKLSDPNANRIARTLLDGPMLFGELVKKTGFDSNKLNRQLYDMRKLNLVLYNSKKYHSTEYCSLFMRVIDKLELELSQIEGK